MVDFAKNNKGLQILTDTGWSDFDGVIRKGISETLCIELETSELCATEDHNIYMSDLTTKLAGDIIPGDILYNNKKVLSVTCVGEILCLGKALFVGLRSQHKVIVI